MVHISQFGVDELGEDLLAVDERNGRIRFVPYWLAEDFFAVDTQAPI